MKKQVIYDIAVSDADGEPVAIALVDGPDSATLTDNGDGSAVLNLSIQSSEIGENKSE